MPNSIALAERKTGRKLTDTAGQVARRYAYATYDYIARVADVEEMLRLPAGSLLATDLRELLGDDAEAFAAHLAQHASAVLESVKRLSAETIN
jgi:hypothetical protein